MTNPHPLVRLFVGATVATVVGLGVVGCSGEAEPDPTFTRTDLIAIDDQPGSVDGYTGAREDVEVERCERSGDAVDVAGVISNPTDVTQNYRIYVSLLEDDDTTALVQKDVTEVAAGATSDWEVAIDVPAEDFECVLRVERFAAEG